MSNQNNLDYQGPNKTWKPPSGGTKSNSVLHTETVDGYHDFSGLKELLKKLLEDIKKLIVECETDLEKYNLKVTQGTTLSDAHIAEWPSSLGDPKGYVSYYEYKALEGKGTRGANYIRSLYEDNARSEFGSNAIDVVALAYNIKNEATNIQEFLDDYIGEVDDSAEKRTVELLQDWTESAIFHTGNLRSLFQERKQTAKIPDAELDTLNSERASQYQAFFKIKVNSLNNQISQMQAEAYKENVSFSNVYFRKFLGPSLKFRLNATRGLESEIGTSTILGSEAVIAQAATNANFSVTLSDQIRRNTSFEEKQVTIQNLIKERDKYTGYITQLSAIGTKVASDYVDVEIPPEEREEFKAQIASNSDDTLDRFNSSHSNLYGVDDDAAHPQYLLKSGGVITGDITLADGVKIGHIVPDEHRHTGLDGSTKIHGSDILGGTIGNDNMDPTDRPATPTNLTLAALNSKTIPPGVTKVDAVVTWDGEDGCTFEFQIARV
jgi:hypothetical protein